MYATSRIARWLCLILAIGMAAAAAPASADERKVKAMFLFHVAKYVTWPDDAFDTDTLFMHLEQDWSRYLRDALKE